MKTCMVEQFAITHFMFPLLSIKFIQRVVLSVREGINVIKFCSSWGIRLFANFNKTSCIAEIQILSWLPKRKCFQYRFYFYNGE